MLRKSVAVLMATLVIFSVGGLLVAPPANTGAAIVIAVWSLLLAVGAVAVWPRRKRSWLIDAAVNGK